MDFDRKVGEVVIPMIAFIEGGMTVPWVGLQEITYVPIDSAPTSVLPTFLES